MIRGIGSKPWIDLSAFIDWTHIEAVHNEICAALALLPTTYTGGLHKSTGREHFLNKRCLSDYHDVLLGLNEAERKTYISLDSSIPINCSNTGLLDFIPPNAAQMRYLKIAHGVYFSWQTHLVVQEIDTPCTAAHEIEKRRLLGLTFNFLHSLPFDVVLRADVLGIDPFQHAVTHRDATDECGAQEEFMLISPRGDKRLFVMDDKTDEKFYPDSRAYYFNNRDFHGVDPAPRFTYSLRVTGHFNRELREVLSGCRTDKQS